MRRGSLVLILVVLAGVGFWLMQPDVEPPLPPQPGGGDSGQTTVQAAPDKPEVGLPSDVVATRTEVAEIDPGELTDEPTVFFRVVDSAEGHPIEGAAIRRLASGADLAVTGEDGMALVPLATAAQLAVVCEGYMLRMVPARPGTDPDHPREVTMVADDLSCVRRFEFVDESDQPLGDVFVQMRLAPGSLPVDNTRGLKLDAVRQRAWQEHRMMSARDVARDLHVNAGNLDDHVYRATDGKLEVSFIVSADYILQAATTSGLVASATFSVARGPEPPVQVVRMVPGGRISGFVADTSGAPIEGAALSVQGGDPLGLVAKTRADGSFELGPLSRGPHTLLFREDLHHPVVLEGVAAPYEGQQVRMEPLPRMPLRGRVRARPGLEPIAGASVVWQIAGGGSVTVQTDGEGVFEMRTAGDIAARLVVQAPNYVAYAEMVDPGAPFADYDLLPAAPQVRVEQGLTATLEGVAFGPDGFPVANASVRWRPTNFRGTPGLPGRRVLEGRKLDLPDVIVTDEAGAFVLETTRFGAGRLTLGDARQLSLQVTAVAGQRVQGLELGR